MHNLFRNRVFRAAELAQQLTALAALAENIGLDPAPKWWLTTICDFSTRGSDTLFLPLMAPDKHTV